MPWEPHLVPRPPKATEGPRSLRVCKGPRHMLTNTDSIFLIPLLHWTKLQFKSHDCAFISTNIYIYTHTHTHTHTHIYTHTCACMLSLNDVSWRPHGLSPPSPSVHGILQARVLEWIAIPFSRRSSQPRDRTQVSCIAGGFFTV